IIQHVITHQNAQSENTVKLAKFAQENGFSLDLVIAKALGEWEGREDVLIDKNDAMYLLKLHQQYPAARRDVFPSFGMRGGCGVLKKCFHISQYGDVFPCVFMHITIGNIFEEPLKAIMDRGMTIKHFKNFSPVCLAGEDRNYIHKYMSKFYGKPLPVDYREIFGEDDFIKD
ncbi:MAG: SPASM domain-containing protein, partial [Syntrophales bacterium LBB04]|nr:SPASM domain-containing protein [Syntrophales bacterium LBB04]